WRRQQATADEQSDLGALADVALWRLPDDLALRRGRVHLLGDHLVAGLLQRGRRGGDLLSYHIGHGRPVVAGLHEARVHRRQRLVRHAVEHVVERVEEGRRGDGATETTGTAALIGQLGRV